MTEKRLAMREINKCIDEFLENPMIDSLILHEKGNLAASRLRAAVSMYRLRHDKEFTTSVDGDMVWIFKNGGYKGNVKEIYAYR